MPFRTRLAWFSPMPPVRSGVATCSAELVRALRASYDIDVFVDASSAPPTPGTRSAHDFIWRNQQTPYDLAVYQLGNSSVHEYMWPYLFRYPGLTVLHDAHLHHARAAALLRARRQSDYRREFAENHPDANPDLAELAIAGFDSHLYYHWPMTRLVVERSRCTAVHAESIARGLRDQIPGAAVEAIRLGHGVTVPSDDLLQARRRIRAHHRIPADAVVFGCFGGLSPEKRLPQILAAFAATHAQLPSAYLLLAGGIPAHYDLLADVARFGVKDRTVVAGYLESDDELTAHIAASDVALNLRWPTAREMSGPWLRCLAAGRPTVIVDLAHLFDVPSLDPRTWRPNTAVAGDDRDPALRPVCVAVDIMDEDHSLRLAMRRLAQDQVLRDALGQAGNAYWHAHHAPELMIDDYHRIIALACTRPAPLRGAPDALPAHLTNDGTTTLHQVLSTFGLPDPLR